jgi:signal transduction histidine kinase
LEEASGDGVGITSSEAQLSLGRPALRRIAPVTLRSGRVRYVGGVVLLAAAYYGAAKLGQTLRYTASVSAIWPPAGLGIAALYLWGLRWWPGILLAELVVNTELLLGDKGLPLGSLLGQQTGNMAEIVVGALLLRRLIGPRAQLDRVEQVGGMLIALLAATAISATVGTISMRAGGVIEPSEMAKFWRTWWLGDTSGGLVVLPLMLAWAPDPVAAWRRLSSWEGALMITAVAVLGAIAVSTDEPVTYMIFPALIWAAFRFGPPGATLSIAIAAGVAIGVTANEVGPFSKQPIDHKTVSTQVYIAFVALTTLLLSAVVSERERSSAELARAKRHEGERAVEERHRIARDLHDSVSQSLFSTALHARSAQRALGGADGSSQVGRDLTAIGELTRGAQAEMRALIFELRSGALDEGLVAALTEHASQLGAREGLIIDVRGPEGRLPLSAHAETELFGVAREALANVVRHAGASKAWVRIEAQPEHILVAIRDDGRGFDPAADRPGHFGLESMRGRAAEIGGRLTIASRPGLGTAVLVEAPARPEEVTGGA